MNFQEVMNYYPKNKEVYEKIIEGIKNNKLVPFIGSGFSAAIKEKGNSIFPLWKNLVIDLAKSINRAEVSQYIIYLAEKGNYTLAAQIISEEHGDSKIANELKYIFDSRKIPSKFTDEHKKQAIFQLPYIFKNSLILTTNYDTMIERIFDESNQKLNKSTTIDLTNVDAVLNGDERPVLFKVHGDISSNYNSLILTEKSYKEQYNTSGKLYQTLYTIMRTKQLFFLGCSIKVDRTLNIVRDISYSTGRSFHLGITNIETNIDERVKEISDIGIEAILYPRNEHSAVIAIFDQLKNELNLN